MSKRKYSISLDRIISIAAMVVSLLALFFAWQGNRLASESNRIAMLGISPSVNAVNTGNYSTGVYLYGCESIPPEYAYIDYFAQDYFYITNTGGQSASVVFAHLPSTKYSWNVKMYDEKGELLEQPVLIQPGEVAMLHLVATAPAKHDLLKNIFLRSPGIDYDVDTALTWTFELNDGKKAVVSTRPHYWASHGVYFDANCEKAYNMLFRK